MGVGVGVGVGVGWGGVGLPLDVLHEHSNNTVKHPPLTLAAHPPPGRTIGYNPLQAYGVGGLLPRLEAALGRLLNACHQLYGFSRITSTLRWSAAAFPALHWHPLPPTWAPPQTIPCHSHTAPPPHPLLAPPLSCRTSEAAARERLGALPVFVMALQCVPFLMPDHWAAGGGAGGAGGALCEDLPGYTIHAEQSMRQVSVWKQELQQHLRGSFY